MKTSSHPDSSDWKQGFNNGPGTTLIAQITADLLVRNGKGRTKYGPDFVGDPLEQAYEEALDLVWYLRAEIYRRETERASKIQETERAVT